MFVWLVSMAYPQYADVIPKNMDARVCLPREICQAMARRILLAADEKTKAIRLHLTPKKLTMSAHSIQAARASEAEEDLAIEYQGPEFSVFVNGKFWLDVMAVVDGSHFEMGLGQEEEPLVLVPQGEPEGCSSTHVLVPVVVS
jgi:DNA polymerase-3 subunit beta